MPTGTTFEADLRAAREAADYSLSDIQQKTRIPVDVLRRFEEGDLVGDPTYNDVYLKAFVQSYAKAVGVSPSAALAALSEHRAGHYGGSLHPAFDAGAAPGEPPVAGAAAAERAPSTPAGAAPPLAAGGVPPAVQALTTRPEAREPSPSDEPPKTLAQARVNRPVVTDARRSFDKNWGTILGLFAVLVAVLGAALYFLVFADDADDVAAPDTIAVGATGAATPIDSAGVGAGAASGGPQLRLPMTVTVTATGGPLQNFRVTAAPDVRRGYWLAEGDSETFESDSLLVFWGEGADGLGPNAMLEMQGQRWTPATGGVLRIDRQRGQALLDSLAGVGAASPAPESPPAPQAPSAP